MEELDEPLAMPVVTVMTIFSVHDFDLPRHTQKNCQKLHERTRFASRSKVTFWHSGRQNWHEYYGRAPSSVIWLLSDPLHTLESTGAAILLATFLPLIFTLSEKRTSDFGHPL